MVSEKSENSQVSHGKIPMLTTTYSQIGLVLKFQVYKLRGGGQWGTGGQASYIKIAFRFLFEIMFLI